MKLTIVSASRHRNNPEWQRNCQSRTKYYHVSHHLEIFFHENLFFELHHWWKKFLQDTQARQLSVGIQITLHKSHGIIKCTLCLICCKNYNYTFKKLFLCGSRGLWQYDCSTRCYFLWIRLHFDKRRGFECVIVKRSANSISHDKGFKSETTWVECGKYYMLHNCNVTQHILCSLRSLN